MDVLNFKKNLFNINLLILFYNKDDKGKNSQLGTMVPKGHLNRSLTDIELL